MNPSTLAAVILEACVVSADEAEAAAWAGAGRVELCADLARDGLTPPLEMLRETVRRLRPLGTTVAAMLRPPPPAGPHAFGVSAADAAGLEAAARALLAAGADALVFGFLTEAGEVDWPRVRPLLAIARQAGRESVFHRAVDAARDPHAAVRSLRAAGFTRVLTSGAARTAQQGAATLARWQRESAADGRPDFILPGGGIRADHAAELAAATGIRQLHGAFRGRRDGIPGPLDPESVRMTASRLAEAADRMS